MKKTRLVLFVFLFCLSLFLGAHISFAQIEVWGNISTDTTWEKTDPDSVYIVTGSITVLSGVTLTIEPGVVVKFNSSQYMTVHGTLNAVGGSSPENTIYFTSIRDDNRGGDTNGDGSATAPSIGIWRSIYFSSGSDASQMEYCEVRWGGYYSTYYGVIDINGASPTIENCTITDNYYGISVRGTASPSLTGNTIRNSTYTPFLMTFWSTPVYSGNTWESNVYNAVGIIGGTLEADAFLQKRDVAGITNAPYLLMSSITIPSSYSLTLEAGIVLKMYNSSTRIDVEGALIADGTEEEKIAFTSVKDDQHGGDVNNDGNITSPSMSDWGCINFKDSSDDLLCILDHCIIAYAGNYSPHYGAVGLTFANTVITNCEFANNPHGIYMSGDSEPQIQNNHIRNCTKPPIIMSINSDPVFSGNTFENNDYTALGIIGETVSVSTTITRRNVAGFENITYLVWGTVTIDPGTEITIEPGVVIKFKDNGLIVNGDLIAIGSSPDSLIVFTSYRDDTCGNPIITIEDDNDPNYRDWYDVRFNSTSNPAVSIMEYCEVRYAGRYHSYPYYPARGGISAWSASPTISHCTISNNVYGIVCGGNSEPVITGNTITDSQYTPIFMSLSSNPDFSGNTFDNNGYKALGIMEGTLSQDAHLFQRTVAGVKNLAYLSLHSITIAPGATLTIDPGVVIKFYGTNLHVEGALIASGTVENNIIFTSYKDDSQGGDTNNDANESSPSNNDWYEIVFKDTSIDETCILDNCQIKFAYGTYGAIRIQSASPTILNCLISDIHTHAIQIEGHSITVIDSCSIINCNDLPIVQSIKAEPAYSNISLYNNEYEALGILQETLSLDDTLHVRSFAGHDNITYVMDNTLTVNAGTALTIDPGIIIKFKTYYGYYSKYITVDGALIADGTTEDKIVFTSIKDDIYGGDTNLDLSSTVPGDNDWTKIAFTGSSSDSLSILDHCIFRYAYAGGLNISNASPPVSNCTFNNNRYGIILTGTSASEISNCYFNGTTYTPVKMSLGTNPTFTDNTFEDNGFQALGIHGETLASDATLSQRSVAGYDNIVYVLMEDLTVGPSSVLTIEPGVIIKVYENKDLNVEKGLIVQGGSTADSLVVFTSVKDDYWGGDTNMDANETLPAPGNWGSIKFEDTAWDPFCTIDNCVLSYGGYYSYGAIEIDSASPTITNSRITKNKNGIMIYNISAPVINNCDIYGNNDGWGVNNVDQSGIVDATNNWWGHSSGPLDDSDAVDGTGQYNPDGKGDKVSDWVLYTPFITGDNTQIMVLGDVSLNGEVHAYDASLILQYLAAYIALTPDQLLNADVSGTEGVTTYDASLILQFVAGLLPSFPALSKPVASHWDAVFGDIAFNSDGSIECALILEGDAPFVAGDFRFTYDNTLFSLDTIEPSAPIGEMMNIITDRDGEVIVLFAGTEPAEPGGDIVQLRFLPLSGTDKSAQPVITLTKAQVNEIDIITGIEDFALSNNLIPDEFVLKGNSPNPFNPSTVIHFGISNDQNVEIKIYNINGQLIRELTPGLLSAGYHSVIWNSRNDHGEPVSSGVYIYQLKAGNKILNSKMLLLR